MYAKNIGEAAGDVWRTLHESGTSLSSTQLTRRTKLPDFLLYAGLGWLAREGKINLSKNGRKIEVSLR